VSTGLFGVLHAFYSRGAIFLGQYSLYYKSSFLFLVTPAAILSMGIDHSIVTIMTLSLQIISILILLRLFDVVIRKIIKFGG